MKINSKFLLVSLFASITMQASSLTTLLQCTVPIVSGITGYKSYQDLQDYKAFTDRLDDRKEGEKLGLVRKCIMPTVISCSLACTSLMGAGISVFESIEKEPISSSDDVTIAVYAGLAVVAYIYGHQKLQHTKDVANATPSIFDIEAQQLRPKGNN